MKCWKFSAPSFVLFFMLFFALDGFSSDSTWKIYLGVFIGVFLLTFSILAFIKQWMVSLKGMAISVFVFVLCFFVVEGVYRVLVDENYSPVDQMVKQDHPFKAKPFVEFGGKPTAENYLGYRGVCPDSIKKENAYRIFIVGGSTVYNGNPSMAAYIDSVLSIEVNSLSIECYNWGIPASNSGVDLARLAHEISGFQPDYIVFYGGGNDILTPFYADPRPGFPFNYYVTESNPFNSENIEKTSFFAYFLYQSHVLRKLMPSFFIGAFTHIKALKVECAYGSKTWAYHMINHYRYNLKKAAMISSGLGANFTGIFQPLVYYKSSPSSTEKQFQNNQILEMKHSLYCDSILRTLEQKDPTGIYNWSRFFNDSNTENFIDNIHLNQHSRNRISEAIAKIILPDIQMRLSFVKEGE